jgi:hypothetical protein
METGMQHAGMDTQGLANHGGVAMALKDFCGYDHKVTCVHKLWALG